MFMIYLLSQLDFDLLEQTHNYLEVHMYQTTEWKVQNWIRNERCRSIFSKQEVLGLFNIKEKVQIVNVARITLERFDKIIIWTGNKYWVLEVLSVS